MENPITETTPLTENDCFYLMDRNKDFFTYPLHKHEEMELNFVEHCEGAQRIVGDSIETLGPYDLVLLGSGLEHNWSQYNCESHTIHEITIQFSADMLTYPMVSKRIFAPIRQLLQDSVHGLSFEGPEQAAIKEQIIALTRMQGFQSVTTFLGILNLMANANRKRLVTNLYEQELGANAKSRRISKVCEHIDKNLDKELSLSEVAALVNMSDSAFSHFFKKRTGMSYINYVNNQRVAKACTLLAETTLSASEICYDCGFNNKSNFIRIFRKKKGMAPIEYRKFISQMLIKY